MQLVQLCIGRLTTKGCFHVCYIFSLTLNLEFLVALITFMEYLVIPRLVPKHLLDSQVYLARHSRLYALKIGIFSTQHHGTSAQRCDTCPTLSISQEWLTTAALTYQSRALLCLSQHLGSLQHSHQRCNLCIFHMGCPVARAATLAFQGCGIGVMIRVFQKSRSRPFSPTSPFLHPALSSPFTSSPSPQPKLPHFISTTESSSSVCRSPSRGTPFYSYFSFSFSNDIMLVSCRIMQILLGHARLDVYQVVYHVFV